MPSAEFWYVDKVSEIISRFWAMVSAIGCNEMMALSGKCA